MKTNSGKLKVMPSLAKAPTKMPKPKLPGMLKPLGAGTGEPNPPVTPRNSQRGIKQQTGLNLPGVKLN